LHDPEGPDRLTVVPTIIHSGEALNMVPPDGELTFDVRSDRTDAFGDVMAAIPAEIGGVTLTPRMQRVWPAMDSRAATAELLAAAGERYGAPIIASTRGGASDASHFAPTVPLTIDGLGPLGANAHNPEEYVIEDSLGPRTDVALAVARAALS
ncbi:MAG: M20/M25/M40 family metallo-hydrolase, partial [Solirubrobacterales bacterium]|nr:M20/M25/M40 family metallo-hydrolase [Solirubrobacterales bacterium]